MNAKTKHQRTTPVTSFLRIGDQQHGTKALTVGARNNFSLWAGDRSLSMDNHRTVAVSWFGWRSRCLELD